MDSQSYYTRQMLLHYGKQLIAARRLARYEQLTGRRRSPDHDAAVARRRRIVERVSREIVENLIFTGSENPVVLKVKETLNRETDKNYVFRYPPGEDDFLILEKNQDGDEVELTFDEKHKLMGVLWNVSLRVVDATML